MNDEIKGFMVSGTTALTVANSGGAVLLNVDSRHSGKIELCLSPDQAIRLRQLLNGAVTRARASAYAKTRTNDDE